MWVDVEQLAAMVERHSHLERRGLGDLLEVGRGNRRRAEVLLRYTLLGLGELVDLGRHEPGGDLHARVEPFLQSVAGVALQARTANPLASRTATTTTVPIRSELDAHRLQRVCRHSLGLSLSLPQHRLRLCAGPNRVVRHLTALGSAPGECPPVCVRAVVRAGCPESNASSLRVTTITGRSGDTSSRRQVSHDHSTTLWRMALTGGGCCVFTAPPSILACRDSSNSPRADDPAGGDLAACRLTSPRCQEASLRSRSRTRCPSRTRLGEADYRAMHRHHRSRARPDSH